MSYYLQYGKIEKKILEAAAKGAFGGQLPEHIENAPVLRPGLDFFLDAFYTLSTCRPLGVNGAGPIPWDAIERFADSRGIVGEQREALHFHVRSLDHTYLTHQNGTK